MMDNKPKNKKRSFDASKKKGGMGKKNITPIKPKEKRKDKRNRPHPDEDMPASERPMKSKNSKIMFDDEGNTVAPSKVKAKSSNKSAYNNDSDVATKWYNEVTFYWVPTPTKPLAHFVHFSICSLLPSTLVVSLLN